MQPVSLMARTTMSKKRKNRTRHPISFSGQAMVETLLIITILTAMAFAALQLCIVVVDDVFCNEAAFSAVRSAIVSPQSEKEKCTKDTARFLLIPHAIFFNNLIYDDTHLWDNTIAGKDVRDHGGVYIRKYNANIEYRILLAMASLLKPSQGFAPGTASMNHVARARMVKSPDEAYYFKAYPHARPFTERTNE